MDSSTKKLHFSSILRLKCPYCCQEPLQKKGSWFLFAEGCSRCNYRFAREVGYFSGAPWMISYPLSSIIGLATILYLYTQDNRPSITIMALSVGVVCAGFGFLSYPYAKAIWMYIDHRFHPLEWEKESLEKVKSLI